MYFDEIHELKVNRGDNITNMNHDIEVKKMMYGYGWICPVCGRGMAPWMSTCPCVLQNNQIFYSSTTGVKDSTKSIINDSFSINSINFVN